MTFEQIADVAEWYFSDILNPSWRGEFPKLMLREYESRGVREFTLVGTI